MITQGPLRYRRGSVWLGSVMAVTLSLTASTVPGNGKDTISIEPYAPNIVRVSLSLDKDQALAPPGFGFVASPSDAGWVHAGDEYRSARMVVTIVKDRPGGKPPATVLDIAKFFNGSAPGAHITVRTPDGKMLLEMTGWSMSVPNHKDGTAGILNDLRPTDHAVLSGGRYVRHRPTMSTITGWDRITKGFWTIAATRWTAGTTTPRPAAPSVCVPFVVTNKGYGMIWDNPSKTTIEPGFNERTKWTSEVGNRVSFFVIAGKTTDEIYAGYRTADGRDADAAEGRVWLHPVQAALPIAG